MASDKLKIRFQEIERLALAAGLKPFEVHFFEVPPPVIWQTAAYGLPTRYSHWSFGRVYQHQETQGEMGFAKIYELIINNNPSIAYLDKNNTDAVNLLIAAHCYGHSDFFANNIMFKKANETQMVDIAAQHAAIIDQFRTDYGDDAVDEWLDVALSLEQHIDVYKGRRRLRYPKRAINFEERKRLPWEDVVGNEEPLIKKVVKGIHIPPSPEKDILWFLAEYANLESWQKKIFEIVRRESYYFFPQFKTKIMNEGWACLAADSLVLTDKGLIKIKSIVDNQSPFRIVNGHGAMEVPSDFHRTEPQNAITLRTDKGISITGSCNHRLLSCGFDTNGLVKDVRLEDVKEGDFVPLDFGSNIWPTEEIVIEFDYVRSSRSKSVKIPETINDDLARFLGYFISEGYFGKRSISIVNKDKSIINECDRLIRKIFGINPSVSSRSEDSEKFDVTIYSSEVYNFLCYLGIDPSALSRSKQIPDCILRSPKHVVSAFLSSYFDGDGGCYESNRIVLASGSKNIIETTALLFLNYGIDFAFTTLKKDGYEDTFQLIVSSLFSLKKFVKEIGFSVHPNKKECCKRISAREYKNNRIPREKLFAKVMHIEKSFDVLYDLTIPESHHYVAQGMINHNSYWHAELMSQYALGQDNDYGVKDIEFPLTPEEHLDFASYHEKVVQPGIKVPLKIKDVDPSTGQTQKRWNPRILENPRLFGAATRLNPYYVGFRIFRDIKERWDEYYKQGYMENEWKEKVEVTIDGATKIRQVMEEEDDVSFMRNYLTEKLAAELHMFAYGSTEDYNDSYDIQEGIKKREKGDLNPKSPLDAQIVKNQTVAVRTKKIRDIVNTMAKSRNNYGVPCIVIRRIDDSGLMRLEHIPDDSVNIDINYAEHVLRYIYFAWRRPVEMIRKAEGKTWLLTYDGIQFEVNHEAPDYPECIEDTDVPSSW